MTLRLLQRGSLAPDIAATKGAIDRLFALMRTTAVYISAVDAVDLAPVPIFGSKLDVFATRPDLRAAVENARAHNAEWSPIPMRLIVNLASASPITTSLSAAAAAIEQIFAAADQAGRDPTPSERQTIIKKVKDVADYIRSQRNDLQNLHTRSLGVIAAMVADHTPLATGAHRFDQAIAEIDAKAPEILIPFLKPGGEGLFKIASEQIAAARKKLVEANAVVQKLPGLNKTAAAALSQLLTVWVTVSEKYDGVVAELNVAERSGEKLDDLSVMLEVAAGAWQEIVDYIYGSMASFV